MINLGCWNIHGFNQDKLVSESFYNKFDIFGIVESWTGEDSNILLPEFRSVHSPGIKVGKRGRRSGGIIVYIKNKLFIDKAVQVIKCNKNLIWIKLHKEAFNLEKDIYLCTVYIPPKSSNNTDGEIFDNLRLDLISYSNTGYIVLMGDFNSRTNMLNDYIQHDHYCNIESDILPDFYIHDNEELIRNNCDSSINENGQSLIDMCIESQLRILNGRMLGDSLGYYTYYGPRGNSTIDYFVVSNDLLSKFSFVNVMPPTELSDHCVIQSAIKANYNKNNSDKANQPCGKSLPGKYYIQEDTKTKFISSLVDEESTTLLNQLLNEIEDNDKSVEQLTENLTAIIRLSANKSCQFRPFKHKTKKKRFKKRWYDGNCMTMKRELRSLGKKLQKNPNNAYLRESFFKLQKEYKRTVKFKMKSFTKSMIDQLDSLHDNDPKRFWDVLDKLNNKSKANENPIDIPTWEDYLSKLYAANTGLEPDIDDLENSTSKPLDFAFTCKEVRKHINKLKNNKQPGIDLILNEFIKYGGEILLLPIVKLFNRILRDGTFPKSWNISMISFLHKSKDVYDCNNYRCLSLTSCLGKLFTSIMQTRLNEYMESNGLYNKFQAGFRPGHRTTDHIFTIKTIVNKYIKGSKKKIYACFVDFSKAFDTVWRSGMFQKLLQLGIGGNFFKVIKDMYMHSKFVVKKDNLISEEKYTYKGVRQGDGLSPILFNIFINDIDKIFDEKVTDPICLETTKLNCLLYADDLLLLSETEEGLQTCIDSLQNYCQTWKLQLNTDKTKIMIFSNKKVKYPKFLFNGNEIEIVDEYKYLGILLTYNGNLKHAANYLYNKSLKAIFALKSKILDYKAITPKLQMKLFDTLIRPILTYGSEVWISDFKINDKTEDKLQFEKIHNRFCKYTLGVHKKASNFASKLELGRESIINYITALTIKYYERIKQLPSSRLIREVYEVDQHLNSSGCKSMKIFVEEAKVKLNVTQLHKTNEIHMQISDNHKTKVDSELNRLRLKKEENKLYTYANIYTDFKLQPYLTYNISKDITKELTKLRISAHQLLIERGRYFRPKLPRFQRLCTQCNMIEDEEHFILFCSKFNESRGKLLTTYKINIDNIKPNTGEAIETLKCILNPSCKSECKEICEYITKNMVVR